MTFGYVRGGFPRVRLSLPGTAGPVGVEFVVDTGFDGELALPLSVLQQLDVSPAPVPQLIRLADGSMGRSPGYEIELHWDDESRLATILVLEGLPLIGVELLAEHLLQCELTDGGEVTIEPL
jgi:predicted aspartyl protease